MVLAHPTLPHPPPSNKSVTRLVPTPLCGPPPPAWARQAESRRGDRQRQAPCAAAREATRRLRWQEVPPATGASRGRPFGGAVDGPGRQHPRAARPQRADPASTPHPFLTDSRPRPRDGAENPGISRSPRRQLRRVAAAGPRIRRPLRPALGRADGRRRPTPTHREPARASPAPAPRPFPPPRGRRGQEGEPGGPRSLKHTHFHIAALVLKALDAVVLQAGVLGHGCARLQRRLLLRLRRRRRVSVREGEEGSAGGEGRGRGRGEHVP